MLVEKGFRVVEWDGRCVCYFHWCYVANRSNRVESAFADELVGLFIALTGRSKYVLD